MKSKSQNALICLCLFFFLLVASALAQAGPAAIGMVVGSTNASARGKTLLPDTTLFSGDRLEVKDGLAVVALGNTSRVVLYRDSVASFLGDSKEVTLLLGQGHISLVCGQNIVPVRVKVGGISVAPISNLETHGEVAISNDVVVVTANDGKIRVEGNGQAIDLAKGETIKLPMRKRSSPSYDWSSKIGGTRPAVAAAAIAHSESASTPATPGAVGGALDSLADRSPVMSPHKPPK